MLKERAQKVVSVNVHNLILFNLSVLVPRPFEVEVFVSGFAISYRPPENISRSQKAFIRLAKVFGCHPNLTLPAYLSCSAFASLPKLVEDLNDQTAGTIHRSVIRTIKTPALQK
jgi:hypothetical protein